MTFRSCPRCGTDTAHRRALGVGTILAVILTCGLWLALLPFYPLRCVHCGSAKWTVV